MIGRDDRTLEPSDYHFFQRSHSLYELTGETRSAGTTSEPRARVTMSIHEALCPLQQSPTLEVPEVGPLAAGSIVESFASPIGQSRPARRAAFATQHLHTQSVRPSKRDTLRPIVLRLR